MQSSCVLAFQQVHSFKNKGSGAQYNIVIIRGPPNSIGYFLAPVVLVEGVGLQLSKSQGESSKGSLRDMLAFCMALKVR